jgi:hypothetical protein
MQVQVLHFDRGVLQKPQLVGDKLIIHGHVARAHAPGDGLSYGDHDEYRRVDEVAKIVAQLVGTPVTLEHPQGMIALGSPAHVIGKVTKAWLDGEHAAATMEITDASAVESIKRGKSEISLGYACNVDAAGWQTAIAVDHVALVDAARCGPTCSLNFDSRSHLKGSMQIDPALTSIASQFGIRIDGMTGDAAAIAIVERLAPGIDSVRADWRSKGSDYLTALAQNVAKSVADDRARRDAFATDKRVDRRDVSTRSDCGCGGKHAPNTDGEDKEASARKRMIADARTAYMQPTSITLDSMANETPIGQLDRAAFARPSVVDGADKEAAARKKQAQDSRDAYKQPLTAKLDAEE